MAPTIVAGAFVTDAERRDARIHDKASWIPWYEKWRLFRDRQNPRTPYSQSFPCYLALIPAGNRTAFAPHKLDDPQFLRFDLVLRLRAAVHQIIRG